MRVRLEHLREMFTGHEMIGIDRHTFTGCTNRWREDRRAIERAVMLKRVQQSRHMARHASSMHAKAAGFLIAEINEGLKDDPQTPRWTYGDMVFQGALVYNITLENGMKEVGRISHLQDPDAYLKSGYYFGNYHTQINRSLYMDNFLYTVSAGFIKANDMNSNLEEKTMIDLGYEDPYAYDVYY